MCSMANETERTLVVLGSGFKADRPDNLTDPLQQAEYMTLSAKIRTLGALQRVKRGGINRIVFSGGQTAGADWISEAEAMRTYAASHAQGELRNTILNAEIEGSSVDTIDNRDKVLSRVSGKVEVLSSWSHLLRSRRIFREVGVYVQTVPAELELLRDLSQYGPILLEYFTSPDFIKSVGREWILNSILFVDPQGKFLRQFSQQRGKDNSSPISWVISY